MSFDAMTKEELVQKVQELSAAQADADQMREAGRKQEEQYNAALESTGTAMLVLEADMTISAGNHKTEIITGYSQAEMKSRKPFADYVAREDRDRMIEYFKKRRRGDADVPAEYEFVLLQKDGGVRNILISVGMIPGTRRSLISLTDITDRARAEAELRASEHRFRDTAQLLPGSICEWDNDMKLTYTNMKGLDTFLLTQDDFKRGVYLFDLISPADHERARKDIHNIYHGDFGNPGQYTLTRKDGAVLHLLVNSSPISTGNQITGMRMCIIDITGRVIAEQKLRESEKRFKSIVSWSPIGIAVCDASGSLTEMNKAFCDMFGIPDHAQPSDVSFDLFATAALPNDKREAVSAGDSVEHETKMSFAPERNKGAGDRFYLWHLTPLDNKAATPEVYLVQVQDTTEKRKADEVRLKQAREETEEARHVIANLRKEIMDQASFHNMVSRSPLMKEIFDILPVVAQTPATALVTGESGTGKELVARSLHELSHRKNKPFVAINCSALPDNLLESELFGYKAGAFTDAKKDKPGIFSRANGGTVFLDEIGDISGAMQAKLLRVLQEKTFEPLGSTAAVKVDVRIVAATNKDLPAKVKKGEFREDLYYRINILVIKLPPLRDRRSDIPLLCEHFVERFNTRYNKEIKAVSRDALNALLSYDFPGNIRELENAIEHAFVFCTEPEIETAHLPQQFRGGASGAGLQTISHVKDFDELEKLYLTSVLAEMGGSKIKTARKLGIHKATLFRKLRKLGIDKDSAAEE
jgi:PAS domain S-box-containing protein